MLARLALHVDRRLPLGSNQKEAPVMPAQLTALMPAQRAASYDGTVPFPGAGRPPTAAGHVRAGVTVAFVIVPFAGLAAAVVLAWEIGRAHV